MSRHIATDSLSLEVPMSPTIRLPIPQKTAQAFRRWIRLSTVIAAVCLFVPIAAHAQAGGGSPFDTGFTALQTLFTGTVAKVASLIAIVIGGYGFAHGEPGAKKATTRPTGTGTCQLLPRRVERSREQSEAHPASSSPTPALD